MTELPATHKTRGRLYAKPSGDLLNEYIVLSSTGSFHNAQDWLIRHASEKITQGEGVTSWGDSMLTIEDSNSRRVLKVIPV